MALCLCLAARITHLPRGDVDGAAGRSADNAQDTVLLTNGLILIAPETDTAILPPGQQVERCHHMRAASAAVHAPRAGAARHNLALVRHLDGDEVLNGRLRPAGDGHHAV